MASFLDFLINPLQRTKQLAQDFLGIGNKPFLAQFQQSPYTQQQQRGFLSQFPVQPSGYTQQQVRHSADTTKAKQATTKTVARTDIDTNSRGPGGISLGSYDAQSLSQEQRQWLWQQFGHGGEAPAGYGGESTTRTIEDPGIAAVQAIQDSTIKQQEEFFGRAKTYDEKNPFAFDEALAKKSATERFGPFYDQTLGDYIRGIETRRTRSVEDETSMLDELTTGAEKMTGRTRRIYDLALEKSREGFAEAGMFFSGKRMRQEGLLGLEGQEKIGDIADVLARRTQETRLGTKRTLEDLSLEESLRRREITRQKQFDIETEVGTLGREAAAKREISRQEFLGSAPGETFEDFMRRRGSAFQYLT